MTAATPSLLPLAGEGGTANQGRMGDAARVTFGIGACFPGIPHPTRLPPTRILASIFLFLCASVAHAADACQDLAKQKQLPMDFKVLTRSKLGPSELVILSNGTCTCNDTPAVQSSLGQSQPEGVFWSCEAADADDTKGK